MYTITRMLGVLVATGLLLAVSSSTGWTEKNIPPGAQLPFPVNPDAKGKTVSVFVALGYDFQEVPFGDFTEDNCGETFLAVRNLYAAITAKRSNKLIAFSRDLPADDMFCFLGDGVPEQNFVAGLLAELIPLLFKKCASGECPFEVKSVSNFLSSGRGLLTMNLIVAVQTKGGDNDDD